MTTMKWIKRVACLLVLFFPLLAFAQDKPSFQAGRDYLVLPVSRSTQDYNPKNKVTVIEFFSYGCPACFRLNPTLEKWVKDKPTHVEFERIPVVFESNWHLLARAYYVAKLNKIHDEISPTLFNGLQTEHLDLSTPERMADFFQKNFNIKSTVFMNTYDSPVVEAQLSNAQKVSNDFMIFQIPGIVVDGKYKVDPSLAGNSPQRLIDTLNYLIEKEKKEKKL